MTPFLQALPSVVFTDFPVPLLRCRFNQQNYQDDLYAVYGIHFSPDLQKAVPARRAEYLAGRYLAQQQLLKMGFGNAKLRKGPDGAPLWPAGVSGSISHTRETAICALHKTVALGIDVENCIPQDEAESLSAGILSSQETRWLKRQSQPFHLLLTLAFSAKESVYKAVSSRQPVRDFHDIQLVALEPERQYFYCQAAGGMYCGRYLIEDGLIFTGIAL